jgi:hypothetical protein
MTAEEQRTVDGWNEWSKYVLKEMERLGNCYEKLETRVASIDSKLSMIQIKVAGIGAVAGVLTSLLLLLLAHLLKGKTP